MRKFSVIATLVVVSLLLVSCVSAQEKPKDLYKQGLTSERNNQFDEAKQCYEKYSKEGDNKDAIQDCLKRLEFMPMTNRAMKEIKNDSFENLNESSLPKMNETAEIFIMRGWYNKAMRVYEKALAIKAADSNRLQSLFGKASLDLILGNTDEARKLLQEVAQIAKKTNNKDYEFGVAYASAVTEFSADKYDAMDSHLNALWQAHKTDAQLLVLKYFSEKKRGKDPQAILKEMKTSKQDAPWMLAVVDVYNQKGTPEQAIKLTQLSDKEKKENSSLPASYREGVRVCQTACAIGYYYLANDKKDEAEKHFKMALNSQARIYEYALAIKGLKLLGKFDGQKTIQDLAADYPDKNYKVQNK